jgi:Phospholipase_D-nuclease N-terminal
VSGALSVQRIGERMIRRSCRQFPADVGADRYREWTAELSAILDDASIRSSFLRALRALAFCAGIARTTRQLSRPARARSRNAGNEQWRTGAPRARPGALAVRVAVGLGAWVVIISLVIGTTVLIGGSHRYPWPLLVFLPLGIGFDAYCLRDIVRAADVRYLRKWVWALICLAQMPLGGILYLAIGRTGPAQPVPPGTAS